MIHLCDILPSSSQCIIIRSWRAHQQAVVLPLQNYSWLQPNSKELTLYYHRDPLIIRDVPLTLHRIKDSLSLGFATQRLASKFRDMLASSGEIQITDTINVIDSRGIFKVIF